LTTAVSYILFMMRHSERGIRQAPYVNHNIWAPSPDYCPRGKEKMLPILSVLIFALVTRHAMRMRHVIYCYCPSYFSTLFHKVQDFL